MNTVYVAAVGPVAVELLEAVERLVAEWFPFPIRRLPRLDVLSSAYDTARGQYRSVDILKALVSAAPPDARRILGVTEADLAIPMLSFLFGQAQLDGLAALVSLCRLRQEFYGLPPDTDVLRDRVAKETLHEMGHTFALTHCGDTQCCMSLSTHIGLVDAKGAGYCARCAASLARSFASTEKNYEEHMADSDRR